MNAAATLDLHSDQEAGTARAFLFALGMHALLFAALWLGVSWKIQPPQSVEVELWASVPQTAAPLPPPPPQIDPTPVVKAPPAPPVTQPKPPPVDPDIALEKKRREDKLKADAQQREAELEARKRKEREQQDKLDAERKKLAEHKRQEEERKKLAEQKQRDDKKAQEAADRKRQAELFDKRVKELAAMAGKTAPAGQPGTGTDARTAGPRGDSGYGARVQQLIRNNTVFDVPRDLAANPEAVFRVDLDPAGYVITLRKLASSGLPGFDEAVERAIRKTEPFPPDASGRPPRSLDIHHRPKER